MPARLQWSEGQDSTIKRLRAEGATWDAIAAALHLSRFTIIERGRRIGATRPPAHLLPQIESPNRLPLPAGHPTSWGAINATLLTMQGARYPQPVFL